MADPVSGAAVGDEMDAEQDNPTGGVTYLCGGQLCDRIVIVIVSTAPPSSNHHLFDPSFSSKPRASVTSHIRTVCVPE